MGWCLAMAQLAHFLRPRRRAPGTAAFEMGWRRRAPGREGVNPRGQIGSTDKDAVAVPSA
ncbi:MAG: hypothetical protein Q8L89_00955 [Gammaproteobacteria bacterium]|nr:hypothetical protein [Gammaproteobacteria bacterium]